METLDFTSHHPPLDNKPFQKVFRSFALIDPPVQIHNISESRVHKHVFPDNNVMVTHTHVHNMKPHKPKNGKHGNRPPHPTNNVIQFNSYTPNILLTNKNKPVRSYNFRLF